MFTGTIASGVNIKWSGKMSTTLLNNTADLESADAIFLIIFINFFNSPHVVYLFATDLTKFVYANIWRQHTDLNVTIYFWSHFKIISRSTLNIREYLYNLILEYDSI